MPRALGATIFYQVPYKYCIDITFGRRLRTDTRQLSVDPPYRTNLVQHTVCKAFSVSINRIISIFRFITLKLLSSLNWSVKSPYNKHVPYILVHMCQ